MKGKMEPQTVRECVECLRVAYQPTRKILLRQEELDKAELSSAPLHTVLREVRVAWFYQTAKRFARAELIAVLIFGVLLPSLSTSLLLY